MTAFNLYEAYAAVYDEDLREDILSIEEDFEFIDELSDNELDQVMEEIIIEENLNINECFEMFDDLLIEARVTSSKAEAEAKKQAVAAAKERVAARKQARKTKENEEKAQRRAERVERIKGSVSRVANKIGKKLTVGVEKAKRALQGRDSASERKVRQAKIKMRDVARKGIRKAVTGEKGQTRPPAVTTGKTEKASSGDYTPPSKKTVGKEVKDAAKRAVSGAYRGAGVGRRDTASSGGISSRGGSMGSEGSRGKALPPLGKTKSGKDLSPQQRGMQTAAQNVRLAKRLGEDFEILAEMILEDLINEGYAETFEEAFTVLGSFSDYEVGEIAEGYLTEEVETVDLYDVVLEHLLEEGYADTEEAATVIMANMSEEWREEILEVTGGGKVEYKPTFRGPSGRSGERVSPQRNQDPQRRGMSSYPGHKTADKIDQLKYEKSKTSKGSKERKKLEARVGKLQSRFDRDGKEYQDYV